MDEDESDDKKKETDEETESDVDDGLWPKKPVSTDTIVQRSQFGDWGQTKTYHLAKFLIYTPSFAVKHNLDINDTEKFIKLAVQYGMFRGDIKKTAKHASVIAHMIVHHNEDFPHDKWLIGSPFDTKTSWSLRVWFGHQLKYLKRIAVHSDTMSWTLGELVPKYWRCAFDDHIDYEYRDIFESPTAMRDWIIFDGHSKVKK